MKNEVISDTHGNVQKGGVSDTMKDYMWFTPKKSVKKGGKECSE